MAETITRQIQVCFGLTGGFPFQMFVSRLTAYFRRKCVAATDDRVQKMNEVLTYIKFIKMYAWVKAFSQCVQSEFKDFPCVCGRGILDSLGLFIHILYFLSTLETRLLMPNNFI